MPVPNYRTPEESLAELLRVNGAATIDDVLDPDEELRGRYLMMSIANKRRIEGVALSTKRSEHIDSLRAKLAQGRATRLRQCADRRNRVWAMLDEDFYQSRRNMARMLGCTPGTIYKDIRAYEDAQDAKQQPPTEPEAPQ